MVLNRNIALTGMTGSLPTFMLEISDLLRDGLRIRNRGRIRRSFISAICSLVS